MEVPKELWEKEKWGGNCSCVARSQQPGQAVSLQVSLVTKLTHVVLTVGWDFSTRSLMGWKCRFRWKKNPKPILKSKIIVFWLCGSEMSQSVTPRSVLFLTWFKWDTHTHICANLKKKGLVLVWTNSQNDLFFFFWFGLFFLFCQKNWNYFCFCFFLILFCYFWFGEKIRKHWCAPVLSCYFLPFRSHSLCSRLRGLCHGNWQGSNNLGKQRGKQRFFSLRFLGSLSGRRTELGCVNSQSRNSGNSFFLKIYPFLFQSLQIYEWQ